MEARDDAATRTFRSQTMLIVELAVESASSVLQRFGPEGTDSEERRVRTKPHHRVYVTIKIRETGLFFRVIRDSRAKSHPHFRFCKDDTWDKKKIIKT